MPHPLPTLDDVLTDADKAVRRRTHFATAKDWIASCVGAYVPTLRRDLIGADADTLADAFNAAMTAVGDRRRSRAEDGQRRAAR